MGAEWLPKHAFPEPVLSSPPQLVLLGDLGLQGNVTVQEHRAHPQATSCPALNSSVGLDHNVTGKVSLEASKLVCYPSFMPPLTEAEVVLL